MIHKITKEQYIGDPCGACSVAYWKNNVYNLPEGVTVLHKRFLQANEASKIEYYFRLSHSLENLPQPNLKDGFFFATVNIDAQKNLVTTLINNCYTDIGVDVNGVDSWTKARVFDNDLWLFVLDASGAPVALGIADFDKEINEGSLEWIQVLPNSRKNGLGEAIVNELLSRLKQKGARFATVSGKIDNNSKPETLYRKCGFTGDDVWVVIDAG